MAKSRPRKHARRRTNYKFFKLHFKLGTQELPLSEFPEWAQKFLGEYGCELRKMRPRDFDAVMLMRLLSALDKVPIPNRPHCCEIRDPVGRIVRRFSRVRDWNIPHPDLDDKVKQQELERKQVEKDLATRRI
jgi:protein-tyrosine-phosphatase